jgi:hypothetical protein
MTSRADGLGGPKVRVSAAAEEPARAGPGQTNGETNFVNLTASQAEASRPEPHAGKTFPRDQGPEVLYNINGSFDPARYLTLRTRLADAGPFRPGIWPPRPEDGSQERTDSTFREAIARLGFKGPAAAVALADISAILSRIEAAYPEHEVSLYSIYDPKSLWSADQDKGTNSPVRQVFVLDLLDKQGHAVRRMPTYFQPFGGMNIVDINRVTGAAERRDEREVARYAWNNVGKIETAADLLNLSKHTSGDASKLLYRAAALVRFGISPSDSWYKYRPVEINWADYR